MLNRANRPSGAWSACVCVELSERALQWNDLFQACSLNSTQTTAAELQRDSARAAYNVAREQNDTERNNETVQTLAAQTPPACPPCYQKQARYEENRAYV